MRYLILSDLHGNREALAAVLRDAKEDRGGYGHILCCGDLCDYGPDSNYVIDWARENLSAVIRGNHDRVCAGLGNLDDFTDLARESALWTMEHLTPENRTYLRELPLGPMLVERRLVLVHGSPRDEDEYVVGMKEVSEVFSFLAVNATEPVSGLPFFFGHTHLQGAYVRANGRTRGISAPLRPTSETRIEMGRIDSGRDELWLINPGSVGQPRDGDPRAAYAIFDSEANEVSLCRVPYDYRVTEKKIEAAGLPRKLGSRLAFGR